VPSVTIDNIDKIGVIRDEASYQGPPEAWTRADNMRCVDGAMARMHGNAAIFGTPPVAPHFAVPISTPAQTFWAYFSLAKGYGFDGVSHTNITRQSAGVDVNYTPTETRHWNGTVLGGIPIFNNGADVPQYWSPPSLGQRLRDLSNWTSGMRAVRVIAFGPHLVALNITQSGGAFPHALIWSSSVSDPGTLPASWDYADPTNDAGTYNLPDVNSGILLEAAPLGGRLFLYKEQSTWAMRRIGGRATFSFDSVFETVGILAQRCVAILPNGTAHLLATQDDVVLHNGQGEPKSILEKKLRKEIFRNLDVTNYVNSFCFVDPEFNEVWFCYPENGVTQPNRAVVLNTQTGAVTESDVNFRNAAVGAIEESSDETWDEGTDTWEVDTGPWNEIKRRRVVVCDPDNTQFLQQNVGHTRNGASFDATLQRIGLSVIGRKRNGDWNVDHEIMKFVDRIWPKVRGGPIWIRVGFQDYVDGPVRWEDAQLFDPTQRMTADFTGTGRAVAVEFFTNDPTDWALDGYKISLAPVGNF
jgi:hypothetical protein